MPDKPEQTALCSGKYEAIQFMDVVMVTAAGVHKTSGYKVFFESSAQTDFTLWHVKPHGIVLQVITPFSESTKFDSKDPVPSVIVRDHEGAHTVSVKQVKQSLSNGPDHPFPWG